MLHVRAASANGGDTINAPRVREFCMPLAPAAMEAGSSIEAIEALDDLDDAEVVGDVEAPDGTGIVDFGEDEGPSLNVPSLHAPSVLWPIPTSSTAAPFDIPVHGDNDNVQQWVRYFEGRGKPVLWTWLSRLTKFGPLFWPVLEEHGLPRDLVFLAMIESGFSPRAYSWAHAAGPWQFVPATGRRMGLKIDFWIDERRDFERSTVAAARYLKSLFKEFDDWQLAWAAYNAGENRVRRAIARTSKRDFWELSRRRFFRKETRHYVPKLMAAALVSKQPDRFGFDSVPYEQPLEWEVVTVTVSTDLKTLARACGSPVTEDDLRTLNPALYRGVTPPGHVYSLRVPVRTSTSCAIGLHRLPNEGRVTYRYHRLRKGDTIAKVAEAYHTREEAILAFNNLTAGATIEHFDALVVPIPIAEDRIVAISEDEARWNGAPPFTPASGRVRVHRVRNGDSLWRIARQYGVTLQQVRSWNGLFRNARLRIGQLIRIGSPH